MGLAAQAGEAKLQRDMAQAEAGYGIESRRAEREAKIYGDELTGAQAARAAAETAKTEAIGAAVGSLGSAAGSFGGLIGAGYKSTTPTAPLMKNTGGVPTVPTQEQANTQYPASSPYGLVGWPQ
jgi:hypothetical protein